MTSQALNSGAINSVSFPSSEDGRSLIELVGDVTVSASISHITKRLVVTIPGQASASPSTPTPSYRIQLNAQTTALAAAFVGAVTKASVRPVAALASALPSSGIRLKIGLSAGTSPSAVAAGSGKTIVRRGVSGSGSASGVADTVRRIRVGASGAPSVEPIVSANLDVLRSITETARASTSASYRVIQYVSASTQAVANHSVVEALKAVRSASTTAYSTGEASFVVEANVVATGVASASCLDALTWRRTFIGASAESVANSFASTTVIMRMSASTEAAINAMVTAADYASTVPAPDERRMVVQDSPRRMEVPA